MQRYPEQQQDVAHALARDHMPTKLDISLDAYLSRQGRFLGFVDGEIRIPVTFGEQQSLRGFEKTYRNIIDYIVRITHKIWEMLATLAQPIQTSHRSSMTTVSKLVTRKSSRIPIIQQEHSRIFS